MKKLKKSVYKEYYVAGEIYIPESQIDDACALCGSEETRWQSAALCAIDIGSALMAEA